jgi:hypothetical protein
MPFACSTPGCGLESHARGWCKRHYASWRDTGDPLKAREFRKRGGGTINKDGYHLIVTNGKEVMAHRLIAERALGRALRGTEEVHHLNGTKADNTNRNLVICPDRSYHQLLHKRQRALEACGRAGWLKCWICKQWGPPGELRVRCTASEHPSCSHAYEAARWARGDSHRAAQRRAAP